MLNESVEFVKQNGLTMWNFVGASVGIALGILKILEFKKKRVSIDIKLEQENFISSTFKHSGDSEDKTAIEIKVDLRNKGLEPTTLVGVDIYSNNELLNNLNMTTTTKQIGTLFFREFNDIRIEPNDRKMFKLYAHKNALLPNDIKELNVKLVFKTTHEDISKKMKLIRRTE